MDKKFTEMKVKAEEKWERLKVTSSSANDKYCFCLKTWKAKAFLLALINIFFAAVAFFGPAWAMIDYCAYTDLSLKNSGSNLTIDTKECTTYIGWSLIPGDTLIVGDGDPDDEDEDKNSGIALFFIDENGTKVVVDYLFVPEENYTITAFFGEDLSNTLHASRGLAMLTTLITILLPLCGLYRPRYATFMSLLGVVCCVLAATVYIASAEAEFLESENEALVGDLDCDELEDQDFDSEECEDNVFRRFGYAYPGTFALTLGLLLQILLYYKQAMVKASEETEAKVVSLGSPEVSGVAPGISL
mmetsp:Transcript_18292/g.23916  ORF Transcript_18292/g.23916 Transcript_18292/m.23916 type:complete len:302 (-) Transcript_18292:68-973(-)|eukprot:CAMPEP_0184017190 /NCGR_PEP_ID=MMETSP0954-20121128/7378_1 /TAXON_ID=627963 /ORGANISM="Aplanochytrium sp, Strain PBS07" /LENGTH=301 /DNA_ID=CAMNT_0026298357 /DNA_START=51 /DNA_END=956 /DNA_ORIENTATION=+